MFSADLELSNSLINQVYQDSKGIIWIATEDGLNRYDGSKFTIYKNDPESQHSILSNYVRTLFEDKSGHLLIGYHNGLQLYDHATESFKQIPLYNRDNSNVAAHVPHITERKNGEILVGTAGHGLYSIRFTGTVPTVQKQKIPASYIDYLFEDKDQNLWVASRDNGIFRIERGGTIKFPHHQGKGPKYPITGICQDKIGNVYLSSLSNGLFIHNKVTDEFNQIPYPSSLNLPIKTLYLSNQNELFLGTDGEGVKIYDLKRKIFTDGNFNVATFDLKKSKVHSIVEDRTGNFWLGIYQKGVMLLPASASNFKYIGYKSIKNNTIGSNAILSVLEDNEGTLWVGTDSDGLYGIGPDGEQIAHFSYTDDPASVSSSIMSLYQDSDKNLWLGTYLHGLAKMNRKTGKCEYIPLLPDENTSQNERIFSIVEDNQKTLWIATMGSGLFSLDLNTQKVEHFVAPPGATDISSKNIVHNGWITSLLLTSKDKLYIGTYNGVGCLDLKTRNFASTLGSRSLLNSYIIYSLYEDSESNIWIGSEKGLHHLDTRTNKIKTYTSNDGLPSNTVCAVKGDEVGNIWISTNHGISKLNPKSGKFISYYVNDGLQGNEFIKGAAFVNAGNQIFFGGTNGITYFNPDEIPDVISSPRKKLQVRITGFYVNSQAVKKGMQSGSNTIVDTTVIDADRFRLSHNDNSFVIELATLDFATPERIKYQYALDGGDWINFHPGTNTVNFTDLTPDTYRIQFRAIDYSQYSDVKEILVVISPAWYFSNLAKFIYFFILAAVCFLILLQIRHRQRTRQKMREHIHAKQIIDAKLQFFINISHEIRTPMTLILSPLKKLISLDKDQERQKAYTTMHRNSERILHLINQLMDIRKIDKGQMQLKYQEIDIVGFIKELSTIFEEQIQANNIEFCFHHSMEQLPVWVDPNNFDKVILNVLANAVKFTPRDGKIDIYLFTGQDESAKNELRDYFEIIISDSGIGIDESEQEKIFECFYQVRTSNNHFVGGTGIGLNLTKSIVDLHHGSIWAENNKDGKGCRFMVRLPLGKDHVKPEELVEALPRVQRLEPTVPTLPTLVSAAEETNAKSKNKKRVLVVDDDDEIRKYICQEFAPEYYILESKNGKEALSILMNERIDLIISDVMMPEMDGITLCRKVKQNVNINHIPVILLTARTEEEDYLDGLGIGADAYMVKPFNIEILKKTVQNIIRNREMLRTNFSGNQIKQDKVQKVALQSADEKLLNKLYDIVNKNIDNSALNVEVIASEIGISRGHLHRKIKELTNQSPSDFVRSIRLQQAAELLASKHINISEVAFAVGFSSQASFSAAFKDFYGVPPTVYMESHLNSVDITESS